MVESTNQNLSAAMQAIENCFISETPDIKEDQIRKLQRLRNEVADKLVKANEDVTKLIKHFEECEANRGILSRGEEYFSGKMKAREEEVLAGLDEEIATVKNEIKKA